VPTTIKQRLSALKHHGGAELERRQGVGSGADLLGIRDRGLQAGKGFDLFKCAWKQKREERVNGGKYHEERDTGIG
jgi:hypothetical protein